MPESGSDNIQPGTNIDRLVHEPARLMILAHLYVVKSADFLFLMRQTGLTFGNLSSHLSKLEAAGYIEIKKEFKGKKPNTVLQITKIGKHALEEYQTYMNQLLNNLPKPTRNR